eukprot:GHVS01096224.1.p1 GENE.GHVS01096224.1~~GHVS01096224.1.p1  ORF type:complete len:324 (+),score=72.63 GHVS01096224.1:122-973(+)
MTSSFWTQVPSLPLPPVQHQLPPPPQQLPPCGEGKEAGVTVLGEDTDDSEEEEELGDVKEEGGSRFLCMIEDIRRNGRRGGDRQFGAWMKHTSGLGLKMLQKYGYEIGTAIGRRCEGALVNPIPIVVHPPRKSLDFIASAKRKAVRTDGSSIPKRRKEEEASMFALLNKSNGGRGLMNSTTTVAKGDHEEKMRTLRKATIKESDLRKEILMCEHQIREVEEQVKHAEDNLNRHKGVGGVGQLLSVYSQQVTTSSHKLRKLREQYTLLTHKVKGVKSNKKLKIF